MVAARSGRLAAGERLGCVIDIETVPDPDVVALAPRGAVAGRTRRLMHRAVCATLLTFAQRQSDGALRCLGMRTLTLQRMEEGPLLGEIDTLLPDPAADGSLLVTFAGGLHDLVVLRQRAMRLWMFDMPRLRGWCERREGHHDVMYAYGTRAPHPSLAEVSALIGADLAGSRSSDPATRWIERGDWAPIVRRNRMDVCATFMAYAYWSAWRRGGELAVATAWTDLSRLIIAQGDRGNDLRRFSSHHLVGFAADWLAAQARHS
jgi:hypothetical protein